LGPCINMQPIKCQVATVFCTSIEGGVIPTLYLHHLGELSRAIWYRTSRDNIEQFSCRGEVAVSPIFGDWYHCLEGIRLIWQFTHNNKMMLVVYDITLSNHTSLHKIHPMHHISSLGGGGSGGTAPY